MKHNKIKKLVSEYIDGELKKHTDFIENHLKLCDECSQLVKVHKLVKATLKENSVEVSPYLFARIQAQLKERKTQQTFWDYAINFSKELAFALILLLFILLGFELISNRGSFKVEDVILNETPAVHKIISSNENLSKEEILELTLSNGGKNGK